MRDGENCTCAEQGEDAEFHPCPFAEEINDDHRDCCQCCPDCTHECAMDI